MNAILTGSHVYGTPKADSDIDLVVLLSKSDFTALVALYDTSKMDKLEELKEKYPDLVAFVPLKFGQLNLLCTTDSILFETWRRGTKELEARAPVTRAEAVKTFMALREKHGVKT